MFTSMVDETTLEIGGKAFEIDDEIELTEEEAATLQKIRDLDVRRNELQQLLITAVHLAEKNILPEIREPGHEVNGVSLDLSYHLNRLLFDIQTRIGGKIPLDFKDRYTRIVVRAKRDGEPLNYTVQSVKRSLNFAQFESTRDIGVALAEGDKSKVRFELSKNVELGFQPIEIDIAKGVATADEIVTCLSEILEKQPGIQGMLFVIDCPKGERYITYATPLDDRKPERTKKMVDFGKEMKAEAVCAISRGGVTRDMLTATVAFKRADIGDKPGEAKTTVLEVTLSSREVFIKEEKETFEIPNGDIYARTVER